MKIQYIAMLCLSGLALALSAEAQEFDEDDLFGDSATVVSIEETQDDSVSDLLNQKEISFSGEFKSAFGASLTRDYIEGNDNFEKNPYSTAIEGDFLLDARLGNGMKAFLSYWASYTPKDLNSGEETEEHLDTLMKEFFLDLNIARKVYVKTGKQHLKWGRGHYWNPTDTITRDRKEFTQLSARREGVFGMKMHVPFGTTWNMYGFVNAENAENLDELSLSGKVEWLTPQNIEMSLSAWTKKDSIAVYGLDFKTYKLGLDWWGELALSYGDNLHRLKVRTLPSGDKEFINEKVEDTWVPRVCFGLSKAFDVGDLNDRLRLTGEFYYNDSGYDENMLKNGDTREHFLSGGYFEPDNYGTYYAAIFSSYAQFLNSKTTLNLNALGNLSDSSFIMSAGLHYDFHFDASLKFDLHGYFGPEDGEYTFHGNAAGTELSIEFTF